MRFARIFPDRIRVRSSNIRRARRRLRMLKAAYRQGPIDVLAADVLAAGQSLKSWAAHLNHGDTWRLQQQIFSQLVLTRG